MLSELSCGLQGRSSGKRLRGKDCSRRLSRPHSHSQSIHTLQHTKTFIPWTTYVAAATSTRTLRCLPKRLCGRSCRACPFAVEASLVFVQKEESDYPAPILPLARIRSLPLSLRHCRLWTMALAEVPGSCCAKLPSGGCCYCCVTPAASLTHKEELRRRGGVVNVCSKWISMKNPTQPYTKSVIKWMWLMSLCLRVRPSCCCGIWEVGLGDRFFIVT